MEGSGMAGPVWSLWESPDPAFLMLSQGISTHGLGTPPPWRPLGNIGSSQGEHSWSLRVLGGWRACPGLLGQPTLTSSLQQPDGSEGEGAMHWAQEVQYGPREGRQLRGEGRSWVMGSGVLHAGHLPSVLLAPSHTHTDEETETQQGSTSVRCPTASHGGGLCHPRRSSPRHGVGARRMGGVCGVHGPEVPWY